MRQIRRIRTDLDFILDFYDAVLREEDEFRVAKILDVDAHYLKQKIERSPDLKLAKEKALERRESFSSLSNYIFQHLSPQAKEVWEQIKFWEETEDSSYEKVNAILSGQTKRLRQELFIHALVSQNFDISAACRTVCVPRSRFEDWRNNDFEFRQLVEEIQWHKKNFFERALMDLVEMRHPGAVLFVNRTVNKDRGYGETLSVEHKEDGLRLEDLDLDLDTRRKILEAIRRRNERRTLTEGGPVHDIEVRALPASSE